MSNLSFVAAGPGYHVQFSRCFFLSEEKTPETAALPVVEQVDSLGYLFSVGFHALIYSRTRTYSVSLERADVAHKGFRVKAHGGVGVVRITPVVLWGVMPSLPSKAARKWQIRLFLR